MKTIIFIFERNYLYEYLQGGNKSGGESSDSALSSKNENPFEEESPLSCKKGTSFSSDKNNNNHNQIFDEQNPQLQLQQQKMIANDGIRTTSSSQNQSAEAGKEKVKVLIN